MLGYKLFEGITNRSWHTYLPFVLITKSSECNIPSPGVVPVYHLAEDIHRPA